MRKKPEGKRRKGLQGVSDEVFQFSSIIHQKDKGDVPKKLPILGHRAAFSDHRQSGEDDSNINNVGAPIPVSVSEAELNRLKRCFLGKKYNLESPLRSSMKSGAGLTKNFRRVDTPRASIAGKASGVGAKIVGIEEELKWDQSGGRTF
ncbi:hypothetical protein V6N13_034273 [Hibiscus sabdariffa]